MIELNINKYCDECPDFEPDVEKNTMFAEDCRNNSYIRKTITVVVCKHENKCKEIMIYLEKEINNGK